MIERLRRWLRPYLELKKVVVNLRSGTALRGIIYRHAGRYLVIRQAEMLADRGVPAKGSPLAVDGEVLVAQADVDFVQVLA